jgi:hypothetical protein
LNRRASSTRSSIEISCGWYQPAHRVEGAHGLPVRRVDREPAQRARDVRGDLRNLALCDLERRAVLDQHAAAEPFRMDEHEPARHDRDRRRRAGGGTEREPRGAGLELRELRLVVRDALGEDADRPAVLEHAKHRLERGVVDALEIGGVAGLRLRRCWSLAIVLDAPRERHRAEAAEHGAHEAALEQRVLRGEVDLPAAGRDDQDRIDQRVRVITREQHRAGGGHVLEPDDLDLAKEYPGDHAEEPRQDPVGHTPS